jgi:hypothetical protein
MPLWVIPMMYVAGSVICGALLPRLDAEDQAVPRQEDRQGLGLSRERPVSKEPVR